jgi:hypothetical protein
MSQRLQKTRQQSHHSQIQADGSTQSAPKQHNVQGPGNAHLSDATLENYRKYNKNVLPGSGPDAPHFGSKEMSAEQVDLKEPKPKGPAAIDRDSDYSAPTGPSTTRKPLTTPKSYKK